MIQADGPGQFTAQIQAFNGVTLLGTFPVSSDSSGDAVYIGVKDLAGVNITSVAFSLTDCVGDCADFALDTVNLNTLAASPTPPVTTTPTPAYTATETPSETPTATETPTPTPTVVPGTPVISSIPPIILVGSSFPITGSGFTNGSVVNVFVSTASGPMKAGTFTPASPHSSTSLTVTLPATVALGEGFASVEVINTDTGFKMSNPGYALLQGLASAGIPTIQKINGIGLAATSSDPDYAVNNVQTVVAQGSIVELDGTGFDTTHGAAVDLFCAGGKIGTSFLKPGDPNLTATKIKVTLPAKGPLPSGLPTGPGSFVVSNASSTGDYAMKSNAVSVPIGALVTITSVSQKGSTITVNGTGFSTLTVINFFNAQGGVAVNLGGLGAGGVPKIPLTLLNDTQFKFTVPAAAQPGPSYVQAIDPPFVPFTSSGNSKNGSFMLH